MIHGYLWMIHGYPEEEDLLLPEEEEDLLLPEERYTFLRKAMKRFLFGSLSIFIGLKRFKKVRI